MERLGSQQRIHRREAERTPDSGKPADAESGRPSAEAPPHGPQARLTVVDRPSLEAKRGDMAPSRPSRPQASAPGESLRRHAISPEWLESRGDAETREILDALSFDDLYQIYSDIEDRKPDDRLLSTMSTAMKSSGRQDDPTSGGGRKVNALDFNPTLRSIVACTGEVKKQIDSEINAFAEDCGYVWNVKSIGRNPFSDNITFSLYPKQDANPHGDKPADYGFGRAPVDKASFRPRMEDRAHRPILEVEIVGRRAYARAYLGLYAPDPKGEFKDVTSATDGKIKLTKVGLMNLGNPMKALLWCEDYMTNAEHGSTSKSHPVVRSFLIPLDQAKQLLRGEGDFEAARPLDQDRASGQFGSLDKGSYLYSDKMDPLAGSLVSFFHTKNDYDGEPAEGQKKYSLADLQQNLTGHRGDPRDFAKGIAAQHGRGDYQVTFSDPFRPALSAYYESVQPSNTDFGAAVSTEAPVYKISKAPRGWEEGSEGLARRASARKREDPGSPTAVPPAARERDTGFRGPPAVSVGSFVEAFARSWNAGDRFSVAAHDDQSFTWAVDHRGGTPVSPGDFRVHLRGG